MAAFTQGTEQRPTSRHERKSFSHERPIGARFDQTAAGAVPGAMVDELTGAAQRSCSASFSDQEENADAPSRRRRWMDHGSSRLPSAIPRNSRGLTDNRRPSRSPLDERPDALRHVRHSEDTIRENPAERRVGSFAERSALRRDREQCAVPRVAHTGEAVGPARGGERSRLRRRPPVTGEPLRVLGTFSFGDEEAPAGL